MKTPAQQVRDLRLIQQSGHRLIDGVYRGVGPDVGRAIRRQCERGPDGTLRLSEAGLAMAMIELDKLLAATEGPLARRIIGARRAAKDLGERE